MKSAVSSTAAERVFIIRGRPGARRTTNRTDDAKQDLVQPTTSSTTISSWPLTPIDRYAFQWVIQGTWVFDTRLDANALKHGLTRLLDAYPILCGRADRKLHGSRSA